MVGCGGDFVGECVGIVWCICVYVDDCVCVDLGGKSVCVVCEGGIDCCIVCEY